MKKIIYIALTLLLITGCEFGDDYTELHDIHTALGEIVLTYTSGDFVLLVSGVYNVTSNLNLPAVGYYDVVFVWESDNPAVVANDGIVNRQVIDVPVMLTVTGTKGRYGQKKRFYLIVQEL